MPAEKALTPQVLADCMFIRFSRFRVREGKEAEGRRILRHQLETVAAAGGCREAWLAQGQHPSTEFVVIALFEDQDALRSFEGRMRSDPSLSADFFSMLPLTTQPPEVTQYEVWNPAGDGAG